MDRPDHCCFSLQSSNHKCPCPDGYVCRYTGECDPDECGCSEYCEQEMKNDVQQKVTK